MSYHQKDLTHLGQILANPLKKTDEEVITAYENSLIATLRKKSTKQNRINVYAHIYGYFKKVIDENLKNEFFNLLELYQDSKISHIELLEFLWNLTNRFHEPYLLKQTIFNPYPIALKRAIERLIKKTVTTR